jgi:type IV pilus assembly protein PilN
MVRINLLPVRETLRKRELKYFGVTAGAVLAVVAAAMGITYILLAGKLGSLQAELARQQATLSQLQKQNVEINNLKAQIAHLERQVGTINQLTRVRDTPAPFMQAVSLAIPDEVWLSSINKSGNTFQLDGQGVDNTVVVNFVQRLQKVRKGFTPDRPWIDTGKQDEQPFFANVKLLQTVRGGGPGGGAGLGTMTFSIRGNIQ